MVGVLPQDFPRLLQQTALMVNSPVAGAQSGHATLIDLGEFAITQMMIG
jgi:hypothetical protein